MLCTKIVLNVKTKTENNSMNNLLSYYGLVDTKISASEKDLPVFNKEFQDMFNNKE